MKQTEGAMIAPPHSSALICSGCICSFAALCFNKRRAIQRLRFFRRRTTPCSSAPAADFTKELYGTNHELSAALCPTSYSVVKEEKNRAIFQMILVIG
jgi:hypothetical protein